MTFDETLVHDKIKHILLDLFVNKAEGQFKTLQQNKDKIWAIINQTDLLQSLEHDDCPETNLTSLVRSSLEELKKDNTNWKILDSLRDELQRQS